MAEYFDTAITLKGKSARKFYAYDANPWAYETPESLEAAKRARKIALTLSHDDE